MDFKSVNNTPSNRAVPRASQGKAPGTVNSSGDRKKKPNPKLMIAAAVLLVALLIAGGWWALTSKPRSGEAAINRDAYQAVFLTNGQVYFGDLISVVGEYASMENIYYLQVDQQSIQQSSEEPAETTDSDNNVQLIKLGDELHGPEDMMQINSSQILFWENLKEDSKISQAIDEFSEE